MFKYKGRDIFVYKMPSGTIRAFYRSLHGTGGKQAGKIYPFDGVEQRWCGWLIKDKYFYDALGRNLSPDDENFGYSSDNPQELKRAAQHIENTARRRKKKKDMVEVDAREANHLLQKFGVTLDPRAR